MNKSRKIQMESNQLEFFSMSIAFHTFASIWKLNHTCFHSNFENSYAPNRSQNLIVRFQILQFCEQFFFPRCSEIGAFGLKPEQMRSINIFRKFAPLARKQPADNQQSQQYVSVVRDDISYPQVAGTHPN